MDLGQREVVLLELQEFDVSVGIECVSATGVNKFHLSRVFRTRTGTTPMEYIRHARLDFAHRLLLETDLPLREIAPRTGFANEYHLSRLLKARYGRGARELRRGKFVGNQSQ